MQRKFRVCREFPPRYGFGARSRSSADAPASRAEIAAQSAALPPPTTRTAGDLVIFDNVIAWPHLHDPTDVRQTCSATSRMRADDAESGACEESRPHEESSVADEVHGEARPTPAVPFRKIARPARPCKGGVEWSGECRHRNCQRLPCGSELPTRCAGSISRCSLRDSPE